MDGLAGYTSDQIKYLQSLKLFIGIPCFKTINTAFHTSCMELQKLLISCSIVHEFVHWHGSLIPFVRNELANYFVYHPGQHTHYVSLDSDLIFTPDDIIRLLLHRQEFVGAQYPYKTLLNHKKPRAYEVSSLEPCMGYPINPLSHSDPRKADEFEKWNQQLVAVKTITTGFQVLARRVFERMMGYFDEMGDARRYNSGTGHVHYDFFGNRPSGGGEYIHEDMAFCDDYNAAGGTVYLDVGVGVGHEGMFTYEGLPLERLMRGEPLKDGWFTVDANWRPGYPDKEGSSSG